MRKQCEACPWRKDVVPDRDIPGGYSREKHCALKSTIAKEADLSALGGTLRIMACHETTKRAEKPCIGWLENQLGPGNNIVLRLMFSQGAIERYEPPTAEQHERLEDTIPKRRYRKPQVQSRSAKP